jgi:hypothetical protein
MTGILIKSEIEAAIAVGNLLTLPGGAPLPLGQNEARSCSFDMTVGTIFWDGKILTGPDTLVTVPPGGVIALFTAEEVNLPADICATVFAINDMSSKGFLVVNPGHVDPGFKGALTVKALNVRKTALQLGHGEAVFTIIFQRLPAATDPYPAIPIRAVRERAFNKTVVETAPKTFFEMMGADRDGPYPGRAEVEEMIRKHWMSRAAVFFGAVLFVFGGVSAYFAAFPRTPPEPPKPSSSISVQPTPATSALPSIQSTSAFADPSVRPPKETLPNRPR